MQCFNSFSPLFVMLVLSWQDPLADSGLNPELRLEMQRRSMSISCCCFCMCLCVENYHEQYCQICQKSCSDDSLSMCVKAVLFLSKAWQSRTSPIISALKPNKEITGIQDDAFSWPMLSCVLCRWESWCSGDHSSRWLSTVGSQQEARISTSDYTNPENEREDVWKIKRLFKRWMKWSLSEPPYIKKTDLLYDFRYLGRPTNAAGCEKTTRNEITATLERLLQQVDALHLPSTCKLWLYQHFVVTKLCWFFTALDLSQTSVKSLQSKATKFLKSWSGLPRSANTTILFLGKSGRTGLHVTNLATYWKQMQLVRMDILKRSADPRCNWVYDALLKRQTSWLRKYPPAVEHAYATTVVDSNPDRESLGHEPLRSKSKTVNKQPSNRKRVLKWAYDIDVEEQLAKLRRLEVQNRWLEWTDVMNADLTWRCLIFGMSDNELKFTLQAITNTAPTPDNLHRWNCAQIDSCCTLCGRPCTLRHVLNSCSVSLHQAATVGDITLFFPCSSVIY